MVARGVVYDIIVSSNTLRQIVVKQKRNNGFINVAFTCYGFILEQMDALKLKKGDTIKINYYVKSKKFNDKYYTSAIVEKLTINHQRTDHILVDLETGEILE